MTISSKKSAVTSATTTASVQDDFKSEEKVELSFRTPSGGGGKAFPCQRFVSNIYFDELRISSEHLIFSLQDSNLFDTHNFDDSTPEGLEGKVSFGGSRAIGNMFTMEDSYPPKVRLYELCHMMGDGIEWLVMLDGSESPLEDKKQIYKQVVSPVKKCTDEYGLSALGFYYSKTCLIDDAL